MPLTTQDSLKPVPPLNKKRNGFALAPLALCIALSACSSSTSENSAQTPPAPASPAIKSADSVIEDVVVTGAHPVQETTSRDDIAHARSISSDQRMQHKMRGAVVSEMAASSYRIAPPRIQPPVDVQPYPQANTERYPEAEDSAVKLVASQPVSTFSIDVDTAAYANARRQINSGTLPRAESVRVEEFINYFNYNYPRPEAGDAPFSITTEVGPSPWNADRKLMLVGLQGFEVERDDLPPANLVFLIDVSGSMNQPNKLGLLKSSMKMLTRGLRPEDTISIAVYAGAAGEVLEPTSGSDRNKIMEAIDSLHAGGSTNGGAGINLAYSLAKKNFKDEGINRVILATDGDFNVGTTSVDSLRSLIENKRKSGVSLSVLGFGAGNYNDALMQELAQKGNGNAAYIDSVNEARKVLVDEVGSTLQTIAKDVKIQVEFNPALVREYRLIGYETRALKREDFNNDKVDAGDIGAGHSVTALYELTLADATKPSVDELRYGAEPNVVAQLSTGTSDDNLTQSELAHVKLRYKEPEGTTSKLLTRVVKQSQLTADLTKTSENYRFAAAASAFGQLLRNSDYTGAFGMDDALELARQSRGTDEFGYRHEFEQLLRTAAELAPLADSGNGVSMQPVMPTRQPTPRHSLAIEG